MGIFTFFKSKAEITIKFDYELDTYLHKSTIKIPPVSQRILNQQPANPSLTSEATGRVHFKPELLGLAGDKMNGNKEQQFNGDESLPIYKDGDSIKGIIFIKVPRSAGSIGHYGIKVEFFGILDFPGGLKPAITFCHLSSSLSAEGKLSCDALTEFPFEFKRAEMPHESYNGRHLQIKYFVRVTIRRGLGGDVCGQRIIWVRDYTPAPLISDPGWQLEVGLEDQLHINFIAPRSRYFIDSIVEGELHFSLVNLKIKSADLSLVRREIVAGRITDQEVLQRFQIIEGSPARYDTIPFRLPLANLKDLTPSLREVEKIGSLLYFVNLIIYDVEGRRYFKQQEIQLYRNDRDSERGNDCNNCLHLLLSK